MGSLTEPTAQLATCGQCGHGWQAEPLAEGDVLVCPNCGASWDPETGAVTKPDVRLVVTREMWCHEAEEACVARWHMSLSEAIALVDDAIQSGLLVMTNGRVLPAPKDGGSDR